MKRTGKVKPFKSYNSQQHLLENDEYEEEQKRETRAPDVGRVTPQPQIEPTGPPVSDAIFAAQATREAAEKWRTYSTSRRIGFRRQQSVGSPVHTTKEGGLWSLSSDNRLACLGLSSSPDQVDGIERVAEGKGGRRRSSLAQSRALIQYFSRLGESSKEDEVVDLEFVESLLNAGADVNCRDKCGQSIFHEVARAWHTDVAKFLLARGADPNLADHYGRTPLHVAAAVDYPEMVSFLLDHGANIEALSDEKQTPLHFAARNDAAGGVKILFRRNADIHARDFKGRTPLHLAAELDRSETARSLIDLGAPAGVMDNSGQTAMAWMIVKMPPVAKEGLDQLHISDRANRKQYYYLNFLEPLPPVPTESMRATRKELASFEGYAKGSLESIVQHNQYELITHRVIQQLIQIKWKRFGRRGAWLEILKSLIYVLIWSVLFILPPHEFEKKREYVLSRDWHRIVLHVIGIVLTLYLIANELWEYCKSSQKHRQWKMWRQKEIRKDLAYCHPRWPEEKLYLEQEENDLDGTKPSYFNDVWNIFDWVCFLLLLVCSILHVVDVVDESRTSDFIAQLYTQMSAGTVVFIWLRLLKNVRVYKPIGPFIVMLTHIIADLLKFLFLYVQILISFSFAFWIIYGGVPRYKNDLTFEQKSKCDETYYTTGVTTPTPVISLSNNVNCTKIEVEGMINFGDLMYSMFRITLVDEYDFNNMLLIDPVMARILCGAFLTISAILLLNMLIALLSDTFQRVYDNAKANALMERARFIVSLEDNLSGKKINEYRRYVQESCSPLGLYYDDDYTDGGSEDLIKVTIQIKNQLDDFMENEKRKAEAREKEQTILRDFYSTFMQRSAVEDELRRTQPPPAPQKTIERILPCDHKSELEHLFKTVQQVQARQVALNQRYQSDMSTVLTLIRSMAPSQPIRVDETLTLRSDRAIREMEARSDEDSRDEESHSVSTSRRKRSRRRRRTQSSSLSRDNRREKTHLPILEPLRNENIKSIPSIGESMTISNSPRQTEVNVVEVKNEDIPESRDRVFTVEKPYGLIGQEDIVKYNVDANRDVVQGEKSTNVISYDLKPRKKKKN